MDAIILFKKTLTHFVEAKTITQFEAKLLINHSRMHNLEGFLLWSTSEGTGCMLLALYVGATLFALLKKPEMLILLAGISFFTPFGINYLFQDILFEKRKRAREELLSDVLLQASLFCDELSLQKTLTRLSEQEFPLIQEDFRRITTEIHNGASVPQALTHLKELLQSTSYARVLDLFLQAYHSGAPMSALLQETAEDLLESKAIIKERQAVMLVTKYTLILAAGIIVPAILGLIIGLVSGLNVHALGELSFGLTPPERTKLFTTALFGTTLYIGEYALMSSYFLALQEGNKKNFWVYAGILLPLALGVYTLTKNMH